MDGNHESSTRITLSLAAQEKSNNGLIDPTSMNHVNYTRTGRISKAKKDVKNAHVCECGKVSHQSGIQYTR